MEAWLAITIVYFAAGFWMLIAGYRRLNNPPHRRRVGILVVAVAGFAPIIVHNVFVRNWHSWFGASPPALFSWAGFAVEAFVFLGIPVALASCVWADSPQGRDKKQEAATKS
jgi:hypothetical protein